MIKGFVRARIGLQGRERSSSNAIFVHPSPNHKRIGRSLKSQTRKEVISFL
jgi:hypothetical protein